MFSFVRRKSLGLDNFDLELTNFLWAGYSDVQKDIAGIAV